MCNPTNPQATCKCLGTMLPSINRVTRGQMMGYAWIGLTASTGDSIQTHQIAKMAFSGSPKVHSISPWAGPIEACLSIRHSCICLTFFLQGGTLVSISGDNFRNLPGARCIFGNQTVPLKFINSKSATCISPPSIIKQRHLVNMTIMFSNDDIANLEPAFPCPGYTQPTASNPCTPYQSRVDRFYYYVNPIVTQITPHSGPVTGGTAITVEGSGFYPELMSLSSCYYSPTTFQSASQLGPLPLYPNITGFNATLTKIVCPLTGSAQAGPNSVLLDTGSIQAGPNTVFFSMNSQQPAINSPIPDFKDKTGRFVTRHTSHVTRHTSHVTRHS